MQRTFNYTNRKKITKEQAKFTLVSTGNVPEFSVIFNLPDDSYPEDALLFVEAYCKETRQRFSFGNASRIQPPVNLVLDEIDLSAPTQFRVLVVDETGKHGKIIASGEGFKPAGDEDNDNKSSLLPVHARQMGDVVWKIEINTGGKPELCINSKIPDGIGKIKSDPLFQSLVLPAAMREILLQYLWNEDNYDEDENYERWVAFATLLAGEKPASNDQEALSSWVEECVEEFSTRFGMCDLLCGSLGVSES